MDTTTSMRDGQPQPDDHDTALAAAALGFAAAISDADAAASAAADPDPYPNAGRDSGYVAPVGEDLVNTLTILISGIQTKMLLSDQEMTAKIDQGNRALNNMRQADLDRRVEHNDQEQSHRTRLYGELDRLAVGQTEITTLVERSVTDLKKDIGDMGETLNATLRRVDVMEETQQDHGMTLAALITQTAAQQRWIDDATPRIDAAERDIRAAEHDIRTLNRNVQIVMVHLQQNKGVLERLIEEGSGDS